MKLGGLLVERLDHDITTGGFGISVGSGATRGIPSLVLANTYADVRSVRAIVSQKP